MLLPLLGVNAMGKRIQIGGKPNEYEEDKQIQELKHEAGFPEDDVVIYDAGSGNIPLDDDKTIRDIPEDAVVASQPAKGKLFG